MASADASTQLSPRAREIVDVAHVLLEEEGADGLSTRRLADRLGIRAPSLYSHFANKQELEAALVSDGLLDLGDRLEVAIAGSTDPIIGVANAYRAFANARPHLFRLMYRVPWRETQLDPEAELRTRRFIWQATGGDIVGARVLWSFCYGLADLELADRFPLGGPAVDQLWTAGLEALKAAMPMSPPAEPPA
jgi:AcrR family transcriptional regulator